ncbi:aminodeoxychorismate synthase component I [bacterium]|nr:aminodeoxychorismate synthase component I [bacterium]MBU3955326.1 aminodeoxychorismate synthase component I [bacterium]
MVSCCFETLLNVGGNGKSYYFKNPVKVLELKNPDKAREFFTELEKLSKKYYAAGFISYELGYAFENCFGKMPRCSFPLALFGVYKKLEIRDTPKSVCRGKNDYRIKNLKLNVSRDEYFSSVRKIKKHIIAGDIYQADYTMKYKFAFEGKARHFYEELKKKQKVPYAAYLDFGRAKILSLSPELFFSKKGRNITVRPMKGTAGRGVDNDSDIERAEFLLRDEKNRSENLMITDLLRNDLGRMALPGTVRVKKMFEVEEYDTLFQMTSTVNAQLRPDLSFYDIIKNIFPSGSVTGAPKIRSMEILRKLETEPRNVYTGAVGFISPGGNADFNVPIRTVLLRGKMGEMGVGSGIVYDSKPSEEYAECLLKADFLTKERKEFQLIETILFDVNLKNLSAHLSRLRQSADYFGFHFNGEKIRAALSCKTHACARGRWKIRVLLSPNGNLSLSSEKAPELPVFLKLKFSAKKVDSSNRFLYHKTTERMLFDTELVRARKKGFFDVVFSNEKGRITEGAVTNIYVEKKGVIYTPSADCGLLKGTIRQKLLASGKVKEKNLYPSDLKNADALYVSNAVIGFRKAVIK